MRVDIHKDNVEVVDDGCLPDTYEIVTEVAEKRRYLTVPKGWCTVLPEPIERGTMVWAWLDNCPRTVGFYAGRRRKEYAIMHTHEEAMDRPDGEWGDCYFYDHVRPVSREDLHERGEG